MTAEMSSLISDNGGYVVWAQAAFGDLAGWLSGVNGSLANVLDLALYPALVAEYMGQFVTLSSGAVSAFMALHFPLFQLCSWTIMGLPGMHTLL